MEATRVPRTLLQEVQSVSGSSVRFRQRRHEEFERVIGSASKKPAMTESVQSGQVSRILNSPFAVRDFDCQRAYANSPPNFCSLLQIESWLFLARPERPFPNRDSLREASGPRLPTPQFGPKGLGCRDDDDSSRHHCFASYFVEPFGSAIRDAVEPKIRWASCERR